jgi:hypothetical protein
LRREGPCGTVRATKKNNKENKNKNKNKKKNGLVLRHEENRKRFEESLPGNKQNGKGKAIPLQAWTGPEGSSRLWLPDFKTTGT